MRVHRPFSILVCSHCERYIQPGQRYHVITDMSGQKKSFCERYSCQDAMDQMKGSQQSGGIKRPVSV